MKFLETSERPQSLLEFSYRRPGGDGRTRRLFSTIVSQPEILASFLVEGCNARLFIACKDIVYGLGQRVISNSPVFSFFALDCDVFATYHCSDLYRHADVDAGIRKIIRAEKKGVLLYLEGRKDYLASLERSIKGEANGPKGCVLCGWDERRQYGRYRKCSETNSGRHKYLRSLLKKSDWTWEFLPDPEGKYIVPIRNSPMPKNKAHFVAKKAELVRRLEILKGKVSSLNQKISVVESKIKDCDRLASEASE